METHAQILGEGLVKLGSQVEVITTKHPEGRLVDTKDGVKYHFVNMAPSGEYTKAWWQGSVEKFEELNQGCNFDIVIGESEGAAHFSKIKDKYNVPVVQIVHGSLRGEVETVLYNISSFKEWVHFFVKILPYAIKTYFFLDLKSVRRSDAVIGVSKELTRSMQRDYFVDHERLFTVYNGVDINKFKVSAKGGSASGGQSSKLKIEYREKLGIGEDDKVLLFLGRLEKEKGVHLLLETLPEIVEGYKNVKCLIVGSGPWEDRLLSQVKSFNIENNVIFTGPVPYAETPRYYSVADIFIYPTMRVEGFPMVLAEAAASGLPVVASRIGGVPSAVGDGKTGFLIKPKDRKSLREGILKILKDPNLANKMSRNARKTAVDHFSQERMAQDTLKVINLVLSSFY